MSKYAEKQHNFINSLPYTHLYFFLIPVLLAAYFLILSFYFFFLVLSTEKTKRVNLSFNIVGWNLFSVILVEIYNPCDFTKIYTIYNTTQALSYIPQNSKIYIFCNPLPPQLKVLWYISNCKKLHCQAYTWEVEQCLN